MGLEILLGANIQTQSPGLGARRQGLLRSRGFFMSVTQIVLSFAAREDRTLCGAQHGPLDLFLAADNTVLQAVYVIKRFGLIVLF